MAAPAAVLNVLVTANTAQANAALAKTQAQLQATTASAQRAGASTATAGAAMNKNIVRGAGGVAAVLGASVMAAAKFEDAFADVRKTVDASPAEFKRMETGLRNMAKEIPIGVNELSQLAGEAGALGVAAKDIVGFTKVTAQLGTATDLSASDAANALARLGNVLGQKTVKDFERMGATLVDLGNKGASTESEITEMALRISRSGGIVGLTAKQVLGLAASLSNVGIKAEAGGTAVSRALLTMNEAIKLGGQELQTFAQVAGLSTDRFAKLFAKDAPTALGLFAEGLVKMNEAGKPVVGTLEKVGLNEIRVRDALLGLGQAQGEVAKGQQIANEAWKKNSALTEEANKRYATTASQFILLKNRINDVAITIGTALLPAVNDAMRDLGKFVGMGADIGTAVGGAAGKSNLLGTALQGVGKGLQRVLNPVAAAKQSVSDLGKVFGIGGDEAEEMDRKIDQIDLKRLSAQFTHFKGQIESQTKAIRQAGISNMQQMVKGMGNTFPELLQKQKALTTMLTSRWKEVREGGVHETKVMAAQMGVHWRNLRDMLRGVADDLQLIVFNTLKSLGVDPKSISALVGRTSLIQGKQKGDPGGFQKGGVIVPGSGSGDKVRALLEPGEVVLNRQAVKALGGAGMADSINKAIPRFATGGVVTGSVIGGAGGARGVMVAGVKADVGAANALIKRAKASGGAGGPTSWETFDALAKKMGLSISSTFRPGDSDSFHGQSVGGGRARATDYSGPIYGSRTGPMANFTRALMPRVRQLEELFYDPLGGWDKGVSIGAIGGHDDHVHVAFAKGGIVPAMAHGKRWIKGARHGTYNVDQAATLAWQVGASEAAAKALSSKVMSESSGRSRAIGHDPGGTTGYGLWQITSGYQNALINKMGGPGGILIPPNNASAANSIYQSSGLGAWYGATGAAGRILKDAVGTAGSKPKPLTKGKQKSAAWSITLPAKLQAQIDKLLADADLFQEFGDRSASLGVSVAGKDEVGWLMAQLQTLAAYRNALINAIEWLNNIIAKYQAAIAKAKDQIAKLRQGKMTKEKAARIKDLQGNITKWTQRRNATMDVLIGDGGASSKLSELQGVVTGGMGMTKGLDLASAGMLGVFGGRIADVQGALKSAREATGDAATTTESATGKDDSAMIALLQEQASNLAKQLFVSEQSFKVLSQYSGLPYVGSFAEGGMVPGSGPKLATVHGGEMIGQPSPIVILVQDGAVRADRIRAISGRQAEQMARRAGKGRVPGRAGAIG
jgi:TP901 family phage tail tape measure protein